MCMMIHHPYQADRFSRAEFDDIYRKNRNGFGIIWRWPDSNVVSYEKGLWEPDRIWSTYDALYEHGVREMVLHWRFATSGARDLANVHPFETTGNVLVSHNGVLQHRSSNEKSDTRFFIEDVLEPALRADPRALKKPAFIGWLAGRIDSSNKLILWPRSDLEPTVVGLNRGVAYRGRWYSNTYAWSAPREVWMTQPTSPTSHGVVPRSRLRKKPKKGSFQEWLADRWVRV
jgi:hypothetical protein